LEPVSAGNPYQYYGLGVEMLFEVPFLTPPPVDDAPSPVNIYYLGGSTCMFLTMMLQMTGYNVLDPGEPLVSFPMISVVARNNRIMNVTEEVWYSSQQTPSGTWFSITDYPYGWGADNSVLTDTFFEALDLVLYFAALPSADFETPSPTQAPTASPTTGCAGDDDVGSNSSNSGREVTIHKGVLAVAIIVPAVVTGVVTYLFLTFVVTKTDVDRTVSSGAINNSPFHGNAANPQDAL
jgi:hypothetical protein